jgi:hypothetical protein
MAWPECRLKLHAAASRLLDSEKCRWTAEAYRKRARVLEWADQKDLAIYTERCGNRAFFEREIKDEKFLPLSIARAHGVIHCFVGEEVWKNGRPYHF